jgi:hypothetical protein
MIAEDAHGERIEGDRSSAGRGLRLPGDKAPFDRSEGVSDPHPSDSEVDVGPVEAESFPASQPRCREEDPQRVERVVDGAAFTQEPSQCFGVPRLDLSRLHRPSGWVGGVGRIAASLPHRTASFNIRWTVMATFSTLFDDNPDGEPSTERGLRPVSASVAHSRFMVVASSLARRRWPM